MKEHTPTIEEITNMVRAREEHKKFCSQTPAYDLSGYTLKLVCPCGWLLVMESSLD